MSDAKSNRDDIIEIRKVGYKIPISHEYQGTPGNMSYWFDPFKKRTVKSKTLIPRDEVEYERYTAWRARYDAIISEGEEARWYWDGYEGPEITEPQDQWHYEYEED